ncbi:MAG: phosphoheptose isomerase, partial [Magnetovibrio sp.]|nr:phosphoheptose isomerase [Magnetovibrio sp.]
MELRQFFDNEFEEHTAVTALTRTNLYEPFQQLVSIAANSIKSGGKILFFGNGGSA